MRPVPADYCRGVGGASIGPVCNCNIVLMRSPLPDRRKP